MATVHLVRHACAGDKRQWPGPDLERPLDPAGVLQAEALTDELAVLPIRRILTSPARRCRQTVEPLAPRVGRPVETLTTLLPDASSEDLTRLITAADARDAVICTHGELMRSLLAALRRSGTRIAAKRDDDDWLLRKGTGWDLTVDPTGAIVALAHRAPYPLALCPAHDAVRS